MTSLLTLAFIASLTLDIKEYPNANTMVVTAQDESGSLDRAELPYGEVRVVDDARYVYIGRGIEASFGGPIGIRSTEKHRTHELGSIDEGYQTRIDVTVGSISVAQHRPAKVEARYKILVWHSDYSSKLEPLGMYWLASPARYFMVYSVSATESVLLTVSGEGHQVTNKALVFTTLDVQPPLALGLPEGDYIRGFRGFTKKKGQIIGSFKDRSFVALPLEYQNAATSTQESTMEDSNTNKLSARERTELLYHAYDGYSKKHYRELVRKTLDDFLKAPPGEIHPDYVRDAYHYWTLTLGESNAKAKEVQEYLESYPQADSDPQNLFARARLLSDRDKTAKAASYYEKIMTMPTAKEIPVESFGNLSVVSAEYYLMTECRLTDCAASEPAQWALDTLYESFAKQGYLIHFDGMVSSLADAGRIDEAVSIIEREVSVGHLSKAEGNSRTNNILREAELRRQAEIRKRRAREAAEERFFGYASSSTAGQASDGGESSADSRLWLAVVLFGAVVLLGGAFLFLRREKL